MPIYLFSVSRLPPFILTGGGEAAFRRVLLVSCRRSLMMRSGNSEIKLNSLFFGLLAGNFHPKVLPSQ